jgi:hypothetical protein
VYGVMGILTSDARIAYHHQGFSRPATCRAQSTEQAEFTILDLSFAAAKKIDPSVLVSWRLAPDMYALARQV